MYICMYICVYICMYIYICIGVYMFIYNLYNIFPELSPLGQPHNLTKSKFVNNITNLHAINNRNVQPA